MRKQTFDLPGVYRAGTVIPESRSIYLTRFFRALREAK